MSSATEAPDFGPGRSHGNELWEFDEHGLMRRREASINDVRIDQSERRIFGPRPTDQRGRENPLR